MAGHELYSFPELTPGNWSLINFLILIFYSGLFRSNLCVPIFFIGTPYHAYDPTPKGFATLVPGLFCIKPWATFHFMHHNASILEQVFGALLPQFYLIPLRCKYTLYNNHSSFISKVFFNQKTICGPRQITSSGTNTSTSS